MAGDDDGFAFVPDIKDLLEVILLLFIDWLHPEVIYDEDIHFVQSPKKLLIFAFNSGDSDDIHLDIFRGTLLPAMVDEKEIKKDKRPIEVQLASLGLFYIPYNCPTNAGILLIGKNPTRFIPRASIQYVQFEGLTKGTKVLNEHLFKGNLLTELKNIDNFSEYTLQRKRPQLVTALRDKTFIGYPYKATRELLMNICQHRACNGSNSPAHVYEYADRLEFDNTGNLYGKARPENFPMETDYRNPLISGVMRALGFVNRFGMGIGLVADELKENGNPPAEYILSEPSSFKVIMRSADPLFRTNQNKYRGFQDRFVWLANKSEQINRGQAHRDHSG